MPSTAGGATAGTSTKEALGMKFEDPADQSMLLQVSCHNLKCLGAS